MTQLLDLSIRIKAKGHLVPSLLPLSLRSKEAEAVAESMII